jgi:putative acetyltransferase
LESDPGPDALGLLEARGLTGAGSRRLALRSGGIYVARIGGLAVGACCLAPKTEHVVEVRAVFVLEEARGQGVGQALVSAATREARSRGVIPTYCTGDDNLASQALARSLGYEEYQRVLSAVAHPRGGSED